MVANTGTYLDAPFHRFAHGKDVGGAAARDAWRISTGSSIDGGGRAGVDADRFAGPTSPGKAVLVRTGWDAHWRTPRYFEGHPYLTRAAAEYLAAAGPALVGIDSLNIDDTADGVRPAHTLLLSAGIPVVEHLCNLGALGTARLSLPLRSGAVSGSGQLSGPCVRRARRRRTRPPKLRASIP